LKRRRLQWAAICRILRVRRSFLATCWTSKWPKSERRCSLSQNRVVLLGRLLGHACSASLAQARRAGGPLTSMSPASGSEGLWRRSESVEADAEKRAGWRERPTMDGAAPGGTRLLYLGSNPGWLDGPQDLFDACALVRRPEDPAHTGKAGARAGEAEGNLCKPSPQDREREKKQTDAKGKAADGNHQNPNCELGS